MFFGSDKHEAQNITPLITIIMFSEVNKTVFLLQIFCVSGAGVF
jgi:hypothetical protein